MKSQIKLYSRTTFPPLLGKIGELRRLWALGFGFGLITGTIACQDEAEINKSPALSGQNYTESTESTDQSGAATGTATKEQTTGTKKSEPTPISTPYNQEWESAGKQKSAEEIAIAEKKNKEIIEAGLSSGDAQGAELKYPTLYYKGVGTYSCEGDINPANSRVISQLAPTNLESKLVDAKATHPRSTVQSRINQELEASLDSAIYTRVTNAERDQLKKDGYDLADSFALFATSVEKPNAGQIFNFDKPLPIGFWPAAASRYDDLIKGERTWTAKVSGTKSFTAKITLSYVSTQGDRIILKLTTFIPEDKDRSIYEIFPIPKESIYTINTTQTQIDSSKNTNWFLGDNCNNRPEQIVMTYRLCQKVSGAKTESFPCDP